MKYDIDPETGLPVPPFENGFWQVGPSYDEAEYLEVRLMEKFENQYTTIVARSYIMSNIGAITDPLHLTKERIVEAAGRAMTNYYANEERKKIEQKWLGSYPPKSVNDNE